MPAPAPRPCNRLLPTLQIQAQKASDSLRHRRRGRGADLRTGSWPQGRSASPPELARLPDAEDTRGGPWAAPPPLKAPRRRDRHSLRRVTIPHDGSRITGPMPSVVFRTSRKSDGALLYTAAFRQKREGQAPPLRRGGASLVERLKKEFAFLNAAALHEGREGRAPPLRPGGGVGLGYRLVELPFFWLFNFLPRRPFDSGSPGSLKRGRTSKRS